MKIHSAFGLRLCTVQHGTELSETLCMANKEKQVTGASGSFLLFNPRAVNGSSTVASSREKVSCKH